MADCQATASGWILSFPMKPILTTCAGRLLSLKYGRPTAAGPWLGAAVSRLTRLDLHVRPLVTTLHARPTSCNRDQQLRPARSLQKLEVH